MIWACRTKRNIIYEKEYEIQRQWAKRRLKFRWDDREEMEDTESFKNGVMDKESNRILNNMRKCNVKEI